MKKKLNELIDEYFESVSPDTLDAIDALVGAYEELEAEIRAFHARLPVSGDIIEILKRIDTLEKGAS